ncbi:hypothetical protein EJB05_14377, partial [Eragrostis curvula]
MELYLVAAIRGCNASPVVVHVDTTSVLRDAIADLGGSEPVWNELTPVLHGQRIFEVKFFITNPGDINEVVEITGVGDNLGRGFVAVTGQASSVDQEWHAKQCATLNALNRLEELHRVFVPDYNWFAVEAIRQDSVRLEMKNAADRLMGLEGVGECGTRMQVVCLESLRWLRSIDNDVNSYKIGRLIWLEEHGIVLTSGLRSVLEEVASKVGFVVGAHDTVPDEEDGIYCRMNRCYGSIEAVEDELGVLERKLCEMRTIVLSASCDISKNFLQNDHPPDAWQSMISLVSVIDSYCERLKDAQTSIMKNKNADSDA